MGAFGEAGQNGGAACGADAGGDEGVAESVAVGGDAVQIRGSGDGVAGATEKIRSMIIGDEDHDVGLVFSPGRMGRLEAEQAGENEEHALHGGFRVWFRPIVEWEP